MEAISYRSKAMDLFLSYPAADRKFAERLREELGRQGVSVEFEPNGEAVGIDRARRIADAIDSAQDVLILVSPRSREDEVQRSTWRAALEAAWQDPSKRLIPVLLRGADLPPFVHGDSSGGETRVIRIEDFPQLRNAAQAILQALNREDAEPSLPTKADYLPRANAERSVRLSEIRHYATSLKN